MAGKIHRYDCYGLRKFDYRKIKLFIDIGANVGTTTIMARMLFPYARVIAIEPCIEAFEKLEKNMRQWKFDVECYNIALGDGKPMAIYKHERHLGFTRFISQDEKQWYPEKPLYTVPSKTFTQIFLDYSLKIKCNESCIFKIDCEGGERYIINDPHAYDLIKNTIQTVIEIHSPFGGTRKAWEWLIGKFYTHNVRIGTWEKDKDNNKKIEYKYVPYQNFGQLPAKGWTTIAFIKNKFLNEQTMQNIILKQTMDKLY